MTLPIAPGENARGRQGARLRATSSWTRLSSLGHLPLPCPANMPRAFTSAFAHITSSSDYCSNPPFSLPFLFLCISHPQRSQTTCQAVPVGSHFLETKTPPLRCSELTSFLSLSCESSHAMHGLHRYLLKCIFWLLCICSLSST